MRFPGNLNLHFSSHQGSWVFSIYLSAVCTSFGGSCLHVLCVFPFHGCLLVSFLSVGTYWASGFQPSGRIRVVGIFLCWKRLHIPPCPSLPLVIYLPVLSPPGWSLIFPWTLTSAIWFMAYNFLSRWEVIPTMGQRSSPQCLLAYLHTLQTETMTPWASSKLLFWWMIGCLSGIISKQLCLRLITKDLISFFFLFPCDAKSMAMSHPSGASFALSPWYLMDKRIWCKHDAQAPGGLDRVSYYCPGLLGTH